MKGKQFSTPLLGKVFFQASLGTTLQAPTCIQAAGYLQASTEQHLQRRMENPDPLQGKSQE